MPRNIAVDYYKISEYRHYLTLVFGTGRTFIQNPSFSFQLSTLR